MNRSDLVSALSEETAFSKKDISRVLAAFERVVKRTLQKGDKLAMTGLGTFSVSCRPPRKGINPATKQRIDLPEIRIPRFRAGKALKELVRSFS